MVVNGDPSNLPLTANSATQRLPNEDGQRFKGDPRTLPMIKLSDLSDAHRRQVVTGLRELVQRTCPETVQHLVEKRKKISDVIDVVKQQTNLTYFNLSSNARDEQVVGNNRSVGARGVNGFVADGGHAVPAVPGGVKNSLTPSESRKTVVAVRHDFEKPKTTPLSMPTSNSAVALPKIAPPVLSVPTSILSRDTETIRNCFAEPKLKPQTFMPSANLPASSVFSNKPAKKRVKLNPNASPFPFDPARDHAPQQVETPPPQQVETPPPQLFRAPVTSTATVPEMSSPTDLSLQQYCRGGISYTRLRTTSGNRSRRGGRSQQRWKSGTIVTHYLALSTHDLADYPDRPPLSDNHVEAVRNESLMQMSMSDCGDMSEDDVVLNGDADGDGRMLHATSQSPNGTCASNSFLPSSGASNASIDSGARSASPPVLLKPSTSDVADDDDTYSALKRRRSAQIANKDTAFADLDVQPEPLSPETAAALHADLPTDSMLIRMLERRYSLSLSDAARRRLDAHDEAEVARSKYRYPAAILKYPEGSALVHCRTLRLVKEYFSGFNVSAMLGKCEMCKQVGLCGLWSKSGRFCSSQCTKRFSRHCQTQQNRQQQEALERRLANKHASSATPIDNSNVAATFKSNTSKITHTPSAKQNVADKTGSHLTQRAPAPAEESRKKYAAHSSHKHSRYQATVSAAGSVTAQSQSTNTAKSLQKRIDPAPLPAVPTANKPNVPIVPGGAAAGTSAAPPPFPVDSIVLMSLEHKNAKEWTKEEVAQFIAGSSVNPIAPDIPRKFVSDGIDGEALLLLEFDMLVNSMNIGVGPAVKVSKAIELLKAANGLVDLRNLPQLRQS